MAESTYVLVLTTLPPDADNRQFARTLVQERLAACVNILPGMRSVYRWQGAVEEAAEHQIIIKTTRDRLPQLWERVRALHPYDVPEFIVVSIVEGHDVYLRWISDSTAPS
jgi:periplasmic divalent cation tolerance protein